MSEVKHRCTEECTVGYDAENGVCTVTDVIVPVQYGDECFLENDPCPVREYVIVCNRHRKNLDELLFWGQYTTGEKRSFGGYTSNIDKCERYTLEEIKAWNGYDPEHFVTFDEIDPAKFNEYLDVVCTKPQLESIGFHEVRTMRR